MLAQAKKKTIESEMRDSLKRLQAAQEEDETSEIFWVTENTEENLFSNRFLELEEIYQNLFEQTIYVFSLERLDSIGFKPKTCVWILRCGRREQFRLFWKIVRIQESPSFKRDRIVRFNE